MAAPRPGNNDRGWNDPPMFDYNGPGGAASNSPESPVHTKLNKRVAYPMSSDSSQAKGTSTLLNPSDGPPRLPPVQILPPTSTTTTPTPVPLVIPTLSPTSDPCGDSPKFPAIFSPTGSLVPGTAQPVNSQVKDLKSLMDELSLQSEESLLDYIKDGLHTAADSVKHSLQGRTLDEVKRKIEVMEEWWNAGKLSDAVKARLGSLVSAIKRECLHEAHELHVALMVNHTAEVNQWLVGVKHIVQELRDAAVGSGSAEGEGQEAKAPVDPCLALEQMTGLASASGTEQTWSLSGPTQVTETEPHEPSPEAVAPSQPEEPQKTEGES